jgi:hypothetical protein
MLRTGIIYLGLQATTNKNTYIKHRSGPESVCGRVKAFFACGSELAVQELTFPSAFPFQKLNQK